MTETKRPANCPKKSIAQTPEEFKAKYGKRTYRGANVGKALMLTYIYQRLKMNMGIDADEDSLFTFRQRTSMLNSINDAEFAQDAPEDYAQIQMQYEAYCALMDWTELHIQLANEQNILAAQSLNVIWLTLAQTQLTCKLPEPENVPYMVETLQSAYGFARGQILRTYERLVYFNATTRMIADELKIPEYAPVFSADTGRIETQTPQINQRINAILTDTESHPALHDKLVEILKPIELDDGYIDIDFVMTCKSLIAGLKVFMEPRGLMAFDQALAKCLNLGG